MLVVLKQLAHNISTVRKIDWLYGVLFGLTILLACYTRFANQRARMQWFDDSARDLMVAQRIGESGRYQHLRPLAYASRGRLNNSTMYYNLLALLWSFGRDRNAVIYGFTIIGLLSLLAGWEIGRQIGGRWLGLACFFLLAANLTLAQMQISVYQRNLLPSLALIIVMEAIWVWKCPTFRRYALLVVTFTFAVLMHYAILTLTPAFLIVSLRIFQKNSHPTWKKVVLFLGLGCFSYFAWTATTDNNLINLLSYTGYTTSERLAFSEIVATHLAFFYDMLLRSYWYSLLQYWMTVLWVGALTIASVWAIRRRQPTAVYVYFLFLGTYGLLHLVFLNSRLFTFGYEYMVHYQPMIILLPPIVAWMLLKRFGPIAIILGLEMLCVTFFVSEFPTTYALKDPTHFLQEQQTAFQISELIDRDFHELQKTIPYKTFTFTDYTSWAEPGWFTPAYLTYFEERDHQRYSALRNDGNNLSYHFGLDADVLYLICNKWRVDGKWRTSVEENKELCLNPFMKNYLSSYLSVQPKDTEVDVVLTSDQNLLDANVFRIRKRQP